MRTPTTSYQCEGDLLRLHREMALELFTNFLQGNEKIKNTDKGQE